MWCGVWEREREREKVGGRERMDGWMEGGREREGVKDI